MADVKPPPVAPVTSPSASPNKATITFDSIIGRPTAAKIDNIAHEGGATVTVAHYNALVDAFNTLLAASRANKIIKEQ